MENKFGLNESDFQNLVAEVDMLRWQYFVRNPLGEAPQDDVVRVLEEYLADIGQAVITPIDHEVFVLD